MRISKTDLIHDVLTNFKSLALTHADTGTVAQSLSSQLACFALEHSYRCSSVCAYCDSDHEPGSTSRNSPSGINKWVGYLTDAKGQKTDAIQPQQLALAHGRELTLCPIQLIKTKSCVAGEAMGSSDSNDESAPCIPRAQPGRGWCSWICFYIRTSWMIVAGRRCCCWIWSCLRSSWATVYLPSCNVTRVFLIILQFAAYGELIFILLFGLY